MNRSELILKFSEFNSVEEVDSKVFFEILLLKISNKLSVGQSISLPEFGYFQKIKGKIKKPVIGYTGEENEERIELLLYSESKNLGDSQTKGLIFNIPFSDYEAYDSVDSHFSLSIGKPVIPLRGTLLPDDFTPASGFEYRKFLESKVDNVLSNANISFSDEEFPTLVIDASSYIIDEMKLEKEEDELDKILSDEKENVVQKTDTTSFEKVKNIAWDFGDYYSEKISPESVLEVANEKILDSEPNKNFSENSDLIIKEEEQIEKVLGELLEDQNQSISPENVSGVSAASDLNASSLLDDLDDYEEVKFDGATGLLDIDDKSDEEFWRSASKLFETYNPREIRKETENNFTEVKSTSVDFDDDQQKSSNRIQLADEDVKEELPSETETENSLSNQLNYKKKTKFWLYAVISFLLIGAAAVTYWYSQIYIKNKNLALRNELKLNVNNANIISRDFGIPVSYPYKKDETDLVNVKDSVKNIQSTIKQNEQIVEVEPKQISEQVIRKKTEQYVPTEKPVSLGNNIYRYGKIYFVQVASFKSNSIAENEAGKYRNKGYNSFVEATEIPGRGIWYRIKVGNFSSLQEAKNFVDNNNR